jgi:hypothetical protein
MSTPLGFEPPNLGLECDPSDQPALIVDNDRCSGR